MVKFTASKDDSIIVGLGIEEGNVERLREGRPIMVKLKDMGFAEPIEIMIFYGKTEADLVALVQPYLGNDTVIQDERGGERG